MKPKLCVYCEGKGLDKDFLNIGGISPCWDCEGTGFEGGIKARDKYFEQKNKEMKELEKNLDL